MSNFSKQKAVIREQMGWVSHALQYTFDNCEEDSDFFEMVSDAKIIFFQLSMEVENLLKQLPEESIFDQGTPTPRTE